MSKLIEEFNNSYLELVRATTNRDNLEVDYEIEKSRMIFSNEVDNLKNQAQRDAQVTILMHDKGWDRKIAEARTLSRVAYYKWSTLKTIIDSGKE